MRGESRAGRAEERPRAQGLELEMRDGARG